MKRRFIKVVLTQIICFLVLIRTTILPNLRKSCVKTAQQLWRIHSSENTLKVRCLKAVALSLEKPRLFFMAVLYSAGIGVPR